METKMKIILLNLISLLTTNCASLKNCQRLFPQVASYDSVYIQRLDTVKIVLPGDSVKIQVAVPCNNFELITENGKLTSALKVVNGILSQRINIKPDTIYRYTTNTVTKIKEIKVPQKVKFVPKFIKVMAWIGGGFILLFVLWLLRKLKIIKIL